MTVNEALRWASSFLKERNLEEPVAQWLLRHYLQVSRAQLFTMLTDELDPEIEQKLKSDLAEHAKGVPVQHLIGYEEFFGRRFHVNSDVLIPRPETEELVVAILDLKARLFKKEEVTVVDVGCGSGAISVTLALEDVSMNVSAVDLSRDALVVAQKNAKELGAKISFYEGDLLQPILESREKVDIFVSNPPYIPLTDANTLAAGVRDFEPHLALFGGEDGLVLYRKLMKQLPSVMKEKGVIGFEVGVGQARMVEAMLQQTFPRAETEVKVDINGKERMVFAYGELN